ncbi:MAG: nicotinate-nucleotide--dimethylbenzimidazole phosphoribosyltransferase [Lachnospiraceae bacterium]|nr:nicotinate-nucleotide--dimethylbenzimidazole phosphoribosyltransferase [Lachnospiraceae bacterium]
MTIDELRQLEIRRPDPSVRIAAKEHWDRIVKPIDGLGDLEELICRIAAIHGTLLPDLSRKILLVLCADNGIVEEGVSQTGKSVTYDVAAMLGQRRSSVGVMTKDYELDILPVDIGIDSDIVPEGVADRKIARGTENFIKGPAMTVDQCLRAIETGIELVRDCVREGYSLIATGEMGIGNTTTSTALLCALTGIEPAEVVGRGAGLTKEGLERKRQVIEKGLKLRFADGSDPDLPEDERTLLAMAEVGGLDIAGLAGIFIGGARYGVPVVIDGLISAVAALAAEQLKHGCREYMIASHNGREKGVGEILKRLDLKAILQADLALGEGSGAVLLFPLLDMALSLYLNGMVFEDTGITRYERYPS